MRLLNEDRRWRRARLHFWKFIDREVLEHLLTLMAEGRFGRIRRARGHGQDRMGNAVSFQYRDGRWSLQWPDEHRQAEPGWVEIHGHFGNEDLISMRNHTAFHLRMFFGEQAEA